MAQHVGGKAHLRLCFQVLGMGDKNGCDIAQATHEAVLKGRGLLDRKSTLILEKPVPIGPAWEGVYLDDFLVTKRVKVPTAVALDGVFTLKSLTSCRPLHMNPKPFKPSTQLNLKTQPANFCTPLIPKAKNPKRV